MCRTSLRSHCFKRTVVSRPCTLLQLISILSKKISKKRYSVRFSAIEQTNCNVFTACMLMPFAAAGPLTSLMCKAPEYTVHFYCNHAGLGLCVYVNFSGTSLAALRARHSLRSNYSKVRRWPHRMSPPV